MLLMTRMMPGSTTLAPRGTGQIVYTLPAELPGFCTPRRIVVQETPRTDQVLAAVRVAGKAVPASVVEMFDSRAWPRNNPDFEPPRLPACKAGDAVVVYFANPIDAELKVDAVLQLVDEPAHHLRLEEQLPTLDGGASGQVVFTSPTLARLLRVEFETAEEWSPAGWNLENVQVGHRPQMLSGATIPAAALAAMFAAGPDGPQFDNPQTGAHIFVRVGRCAGYGPDVLTVRVVLEPRPPRAPFKRSSPAEMGALRAELYGDDGSGGEEK